MRVNLISVIIEDLSYKSPCLDGIASEHVCGEIGRSTTASVVGSVNVSHVLTRGYVPRNMLEPVIVPITKDKN